LLAPDQIKQSLKDLLWLKALNHPLEKWKVSGMNASSVIDQNVLLKDITLSEFCCHNAFQSNNHGDGGPI
jgi:hypothetical protein